MLIGIKLYLLVYNIAVVTKYWSCGEYQAAFACRGMCSRTWD